MFTWYNICNVYYVLTNTNWSVARSKMWDGQHIVFTRGQRRGVTKMWFAKNSAVPQVLCVCYDDKRRTDFWRLLEYYRPSGQRGGGVSPIPLSIRHCNLFKEKLILSGYFHSAWWIGNYVAVAIKCDVRPCSDFMDMLRRLISCRIIIIIIKNLLLCQLLYMKSSVTYQ